jgi:hypothetical protein
MNTQTHNNTSNGAASSGAFGQREKIIFGESAQIVKLETEPAQATQSEGNWGPQFTYRLAGNKITWLDPDPHQKMLELGAHAGDELAIAKRKRGRRYVWEVLPVQEEPTPRAATPLPSDRPAPQFSTISAPRETAPPPIRAGERIAGNLMAAALKQAIEACDLAEFHATHDDVRALAITIYIHATEGKK